LLFPRLIFLSVFVLSVVVIEANAQTQPTESVEHLLKISSSPNILYLGGTGFYPHGIAVTVDPAPETWQEYRFVGWKIDGMWSSENPPTILMNRSHEVQAVYTRDEGIGEIVIDAIPQVTSITVDGTIYLADELPLTFDWEVDSTHTISTMDVVKQNPNTRYKFDSWKDQNQETSRTITIKEDESNFIAIYKTQHFLKPISEQGTVLGGGWQDEGSSVNFELELDVIVDKKNENIRYVFESWNLGDYLNSPTNTIDVEEPISVKANWNKQFKLELKTNIPEYNLFGTGWYDENRQVALIAEESLESLNSDIKYVFDRWVSKGPNPVIIPNAHQESTTITISEPYVIEAKFKKSYLVNVWSPFGSAIGGGFYPEGEVAEISMERTEIIVDPRKIKKIFTGWNPHGARTMNLASEDPELAGMGVGSVQNLLLLVEKPTNVTAQWKTQFYLNVESSEGSVEGAGWYDLGRLAPIKVNVPSTPAGFWSSQTFDKWTGDMESEKIRERVLINKPKTVIAEWKEDRTAGIINSLVLGGVAAIGIVIFAKTRNGKLSVFNGKKAHPTNPSTKSPTNPPTNPQGDFEKFFNTRSRGSDLFQKTPSSPSKKGRMSTIVGWLMGRGD